MTPKEKSIYLYNKFMQMPFPTHSDRAKQCALICVDVILNDCGAKDWEGDVACDGKNYWLAVKMELEKL